jgi:hypothetical protein
MRIFMLPPFSIFSLFLSPSHFYSFVLSQLPSLFNFVNLTSYPLLLPHRDAILILSHKVKSLIKIFRRSDEHRLVLVNARHEE